MSTPDPTARPSAVGVSGRWTLCNTLLGCAGAVLLSQPAMAQVNWTFRGPTAPIARVENALVYDSVNQRMVNFGGYDINFNRMNDMWEYNGATRVWTNVTPATSPSRRQGAAMAYDPPRQRILLFGGTDEAGTVLGDTWEWNAVAKTWTPLFPSPAPVPRVGSRMVYDTANGRIILYGGWNSTTTQHFSDTWAWNPTNRTWANLSPAGSPGIRTYHGLVYNTTNNRVTIFGGVNGGSYLNDLWELNSQTNTWINVTPGGAAPQGRAWSGVAYETTNGRLVTYGGWSGSFSFSDIWAWNGSSWTQLSVTPNPPTNVPTARDSHQMAWDSTRNVSVVFGGFDNDVQELANSTWTLATRTRWPPEDDEHAIALDIVNSPGHRRIFEYGGGSPHIHETFAQSQGDGVLAWRSPWIVSPNPGGRIGHDMVYDSRTNPAPAIDRNRALLFGGRQRDNGVVGATVFGDTWAFRRTPGLADAQWTNLGVAGPPARYDHAMVYDRGRDQVILFGGRNAAGTPLADAWLWNGSGWSPIGGGPAARYNHTMAYDDIRGVIVLFGGENGSQKLGDTWEWNGSSWAQRATTGPSPRDGAAMAHTGNTCGVLLFGGRNQAGQLLGDHWTWDNTSSSWLTISPSGGAPAARVNARMLWNPAEGHLWLFGGRTAGGRTGEMWTSTVGPGCGTLPANSSLTINDVTVAEGTGGATNAIFTVTLSPTSGQTVTVSFTTANGSAVAPGDYAVTSGTRTFMPGQATQTVSVPITTDGTPELDETFTLNLSAPVNATVADGQGIGTIVNDDLPAVSINDVTVTEGNTGAQDAVFTVSLSQSAPFPSSVNYGAAAGTATAGVDFGTVGGTVNFPAGSTSQTVAVPVVGDFADEPSETFFVNLSTPGNATIADGQGQGTIQDNDAPGLTIADVAVRERWTPNTTTVTFTVTNAPTSGGTVTVDWATANGTATAGSDYVAGAGTLTFNPGVATQPIAVTINPDALVEPLETFVVNLSGASGAAIARSQATARILDPPGGADFNGDRLTDILWRHDVSGENVLWFMNGANFITGTFTTPSALTDVRWKMVGTNDFNLDGRPDILWRHNTSGENVLWFMNGSVLINGTFLTPAALTDVRWFMAGTGDFNLDGRADILWRHNTSGEIVVWFMNGSVLTSGNFLTPSAFADVNWQTVGTGDFNLDGKTDILWRHALSGQNVVWFMEGTSLVSGTFTNPPTLDDVRWRMSATGDYNTDGKVDIVWRHSQSGQNVLWFMDGTTLASGTFITPSMPDTNWKIVGPR